MTMNSPSQFRRAWFRKRTIAAERGVISLIPENGQVPHTLFGKAKLEALRHGGFFGGVLKPGEYRSAAIDLTRRST